MKALKWINNIRYMSSYFISKLRSFLYSFRIKLVNLSRLTNVGHQKLYDISAYNQQLFCTSFARRLTVQSMSCAILHQGIHLSVYLYVKINYFCTSLVWQNHPNAKIKINWPMTEGMISSTWTFFSYLFTVTISGVSFT